MTVGITLLGMTLFTDMFGSELQVTTVGLMLLGKILWNLSKSKKMLPTIIVNPFCMSIIGSELSIRCPRNKETIAFVGCLTPVVVHLCRLLRFLLVAGLLSMQDISHVNYYFVVGCYNSRVCNNGNDPICSQAFKFCGSALGILK